MKKNTKITKKLPNLVKICSCSSKRTIFCLSGRARYSGLLFGGPRYRTITKKGNESRCRASIKSVIDPIRVTEDFEEQIALAEKKSQEI